MVKDSKYIATNQITANMIMKESRDEKFAFNRSVQLIASVYMTSLEVNCSRHSTALYVRSPNIRFSRIISCLGNP